MAARVELRALLHLAAQPRQFVRDAVQALSQALHHRGDALALLLGQLVELLGRQRLPVLRRRKREARGRTQQRHPLLSRAVPELLQRALLALLELLLDRLDPRAVLVALERGRDRLAQFGDEALHRSMQECALAGWQAQRPRLVRVGEVVEVAPIHRLRPGRRVRLEQPAHDAMAAAAGLAEHEEIEAPAGDVQPQRHRIDRARLAEDVRRLGQRGGRGEVELRRVAADAQPRCVQLLSVGHVVPSFVLRLPAPFEPPCSCCARSAP
ncbi:MAG TPA: hypothetical protein VMT83_18750 [Burkholderiaceae bacterium]|nr:hypothetical protein [Burkholderiaceae bacterium]